MYLSLQRAAVLSHGLRPGERLPSTRTLAAELDVSRTVVLLGVRHIGNTRGKGSSSVGAARGRTSRVGSAGAARRMLRTPRGQDPTLVVRSGCRSRRDLGEFLPKRRPTAVPSTISRYGSDRDAREFPSRGVASYTAPARAEAETSARSSDDTGPSGGRSRLTRGRCQPPPSLAGEAVWRRISR